MPNKFLAFCGPHPKTKIENGNYMIQANLITIFSTVQGHCSSGRSEQLVSQTKKKKERKEKRGLKFFDFFISIFSSSRELKMGILIGSSLIKWLLLVVLISRAKWRMV